jgi:hypothetical protein
MTRVRQVRGPHLYVLHLWARRCPSAPKDAGARPSVLWDSGAPGPLPLDPLNDQHGRLVGVVVPLADHAQRSLAEMERVARAQLGTTLVSCLGSAGAPSSLKAE